MSDILEFSLAHKYHNHEVRTYRVLSAQYKVLCELDTNVALKVSDIISTSQPHRSGSKSVSALYWRTIPWCFLKEIRNA
jgi:hypothetical protein